MEQVYYTQCPMGHGLGAAGGFQLKRISPGYPRTADFRSLGLKVQMSGLSVLSPKALRFRWDGPEAEIAWLSPRAREFEVAVGDGSKTRQYGRPGGLFAHGLRLGPEEFAQLDEWPAGLFGWKVWVESDPVPTAGKNLDPIALTERELSKRQWYPVFSFIATLAARHSRERLACLFHSVAEVTRTGRTLFLFDDDNKANGESLAELIAVLTFGFPKGLRRDLTFSTFHDRPSALPGYRIQGTTALGRADLPSMQALGVVEELARDPRSPSRLPRWASTLAGWLIGGHEKSWASTCESLFPLVRARLSRNQVWEDASLDALFSFVEWNGLPPDRMADRPVREQMASLVSWAGKAGLARAWRDRHGPDWWTGALKASGASGTACSILLAQASWAGSEKSSEKGSSPAPEARRWADVAALGFGAREETDWRKAVRTFLIGLSSPDRLPFLSGLMTAAPQRAEATLAWLQEASVVPASLVMPLWAVRQLGPPMALDRLRKVLVRSMVRPDAIPRVLEALQSELQVRDQAAETLSTALADALFEARASLTPDAWQGLWTVIVSWAVRGDEARGWLSAVLSRTFSPPFDPEDWSILVDRLPDRDRAAFLPVALAASLALPGDGRAYLWCVEALWLAVPALDRIDASPLDQDWSNPDRTWVNAYVERLPADLDQFARLFPPLGSESSLSVWIDEARHSDPSPLSPRNRERLDSWERVEKARQSGLPRSMLQITSAEVPETDRGRWLARILEGLGRADRSGYLDDLESCGRAWSQAFESGSPHLDLVAAPLAKALEPFLPTPGRWMEMLANMESRLHVPDQNEPVRSVGLSAHVLAWTCRERPDRDLWNLRRAVLESRDWPILRIDLEVAIQSQPPEQAVSVVENWDTQATEGALGLRSRFHALILNACSGAWLSKVGSARAHYLKGESLPWWDHDQNVAGRDDARDAFVRRVPMGPLPYENLPALRSWLGIPPLEFDASLCDPREPPPSEEAGPILVPEGEDALTSGSSEKSSGFTHLSALGLARWCALHALTSLSSGGVERSRDVYDRIRILPVDRLDLDDRYRFLAWVLMRTDLTETSFADPLARWLAAQGIDDDERIKNWSSPIAGQIGPDSMVQKPGLLEFIHALRSEVRRTKQERRENRRGASRSRPDSSL